MTKRCNKCRTVRPVDDFYPDRSKKDGRHTICKVCALAARKLHYIANKERINADNRARHPRYRDAYRERRRALRLESIARYGGKCACCGETEPDFLCIDHVNNDGAEHRRKQTSAYAIHLWLRREGYPQDGRFQVLCHNCNIAKGIYGSCPHQRLQFIDPKHGRVNSDHRIFLD